MITISQQQALWRWDRIPEKLRGVLTSEVSSDFVWSVCGDQHLPEDKIKLVSKLAGYVICGFLHPEDLAREIKIQAGVPEQIAAAVADGLNKRIFAPIRSDIDAVFNPRPDDGPLEEEIEDEGESSPILFQEIRPPAQGSGEAGPSTPLRAGAPPPSSVPRPQPSSAGPQLSRQGSFDKVQDKSGQARMDAAHSSFIPSPLKKEGAPTFQPGWSHSSPLGKVGEPQTKPSSEGARPSSGQGYLPGGQPAQSAPLGVAPSTPLPSSSFGAGGTSQDKPASKPAIMLQPLSVPGSTPMPKPPTQTTPTALSSLDLPPKSSLAQGEIRESREGNLDSRLRGNDRIESGNDKKKENDIVSSTPAFQQPKEVPLSFSRISPQQEIPPPIPQKPASIGPISPIGQVSPTGSIEPMPVILHEEPKAVPTKSSGFSFTPRPPGISDVTFSAKNILPRPAVFEFGKGGGIAPAPKNVAPTAPKVVHYSEMKTPLPPMPPKPPAQA